jgi:hypothetical protein
MRHRPVVTLGAAFVLALVLFTGTALAGKGGVPNGGVGNGNGNGNEAHTATPAAQPAAQPVQPAPTRKASPGRAKHTSSAGVKAPSATHNTSAPASSNQTKLYGNGKTAGQIATAAGYGSATLYGPGASQPHKVNCGPHAVDVHALPHNKHCAPPQQTATQTQVAAVQKTAIETTAATAPVVASTGEVLGATVALKAPASSTAPGGVLGTLRPLGSSVAAATLPFTGLQLWVFALAGLSVLGLGLVARRASRIGEAWSWLRSGGATTRRFAERSSSEFSSAPKSSAQAL